jgi:uncharacterized membrane protein
MLARPPVLAARPAGAALAPRPARRAPARPRAARGGADDGPSTSGRPPAGAGGGGGGGAAAEAAARRFPFGAIAAAAAAGLAETGYLTATKLAGVAAVCPVGGGCAGVLDSDAALLFGTVPLSAAGAAAYAGVLAVAAAGRAAAARGDGAAEYRAREGVLAGAALLAAASAYLVRVLVVDFPGELCPWCLGSAALSATIAALAVAGARRRELADAAAPGLGLAAAALLALSLAAGSPDASRAGGVAELAYVQPAVAARSPPGAAALAARLRAAGAQMYGAFWCSHCLDQKEAFGAEAMAAFPYVECFPGGWRAGEEMAPACAAAAVKGFPTWVAGAERLEGEQTFEVLEVLAARAEAASAKVAAAAE